VAAGFGRHGMPPPASNDTVLHWAKTVQTDHVTLRPRSLTLEVVAPAADAGRRRPPSVHGTPSLKFVSLGVRKIWRTMCVSINGPGDFDL